VPPRHAARMGAAGGSRRGGKQCTQAGAFALPPGPQYQHHTCVGRTLQQNQRGQRWSSPIRNRRRPNAMEAIEPSEFDLVVLGTGLTESIVAA
jgi:hypothetical protein